MSYKTHQKTGYHGKHHRLQTHILKSKGQKLGKRKFPTEMWVSKFKRKKFAFSEKNWWVLKMLRKKMVIHGKKLVGGYQIGPGTNFRHTFRKYLPGPPPCAEHK